MSFYSKFKNAILKNNSRVCVGLDIDANKLPVGLTAKKDDILSFSKSIIDATKDHVCAYKPNMAFYEALGFDGLDILHEVCEQIPSYIPIIMDAKRGDIGNTAAKYAKSIFEDFKADATTLSPYMGYDSVKPFLDYEDKTSFILCVTSNSSSTDFQKVKFDDKFLYELVAEKCNEWNQHKNVGLVVGATNPEELKTVRSICPDIPFLIPGVGAQGGSVKDCVDNALTIDGEIAINSSRGIIYASMENDFANAANKAVLKLKEEINSYLS